MLRNCILSLGILVGLLVISGCKSYGPRFNAREESPKVEARLHDGHAPNLLRLDEKDFESVTLTNQIEPGWLQPPTNFFRLGPGDVIEIEMLDEPGSAAPATVGADGKIYYYLLPGVSVWNLSLAETKGLLEDKLAKYMRIQPEIAITIRSVQSRNVWILGSVGAPGLYPLITPMTILEAVTRAGGPASASSLDTVDWANSFLLREGELLRVDLQALFRRGDLSQNIYLQPNDYLYLRPMETQNIYVMGSVSRVGALPYSPRFSLLKAIMLSGGTQPLAYLSHVAILRGSLSQPRIAIVNFAEIRKGKKPDILLEPNDIVYVPKAPYAYVVNLADMIVKRFVSTWALNEGRFAVDRTGGTVGVSVGY